MPAHQDRPDMTHQRHVTSLRTDLGLRLVPPSIGTELQTITTFAYAKVETRLRSALPRYAVLPPDQRRSLLLAIAHVIEEFTSVVEEQPLTTPTADAVLIEIARKTDQPERFLIALHTARDLIRTAMRELWAHLPHAHARPYSTRLETALARYTERLCERTINALHPPTGEPSGPGKAEEARLARLFAQAERQWNSKPGQLCLRISAPVPDHTTPTARRHPVTPDRHRPAGPLVLRLGDHLLAIAEHRPPDPRIDRAAQATRVTRPARPAGAICIGPFPVSKLPAAYEIALLRFRLVSAGVAAPPPPALLPLPDLGFLHTIPSEATVTTIATLLEPLAKQSTQRRATLARTLQHRLQATGTAQDLADLLGLHPHTVHNHLTELHKLYDSHDLDITTNSFAIRAALTIVLPLWALEAASTR